MASTFSALSLGASAAATSHRALQRPGENGTTTSANRGPPSAVRPAWSTAWAGARPRSMCPAGGTIDGHDAGRGPVVRAREWAIAPTACPFARSPTGLRVHRVGAIHHPHHVVLDLGTTVGRGGKRDDDLAPRRNGIGSHAQVAMDRAGGRTRDRLGGGRQRQEAPGCRHRRGRQRSRELAKTGPVAAIGRGSRERSRRRCGPGPRDPARGTRGRVRRR